MDTTLPSFPRLARLLCGGSFALYVVSFFLYVGHHPWEGSEVWGWQAFFESGHSLLTHPDQGQLWRLWLPNPLLWLALVCLWRHSLLAAVYLGAGATFLAGWAMFEWKSSWHEGPGAPVWFASMLLLTIGSLILEAPETARDLRNAWGPKKVGRLS